MKIFNSIIMASCLFVSSLSASSIFEGDNANLWLVDESGQVSAYRDVSGDHWILDFSPGGAPRYPLQGQDQALVNNLRLSSQNMSRELASISIADLSKADLIVGVDNGNSPLGVYPENGNYTETIKVEIAVDAELLSSHPSPLMLQWEIVGQNNGDTLGSAVITDRTENVDGRLRASFYLVKADDYVIDIVLRDSNGIALASTDAIYNITTSDVEGDQRDTDKDGLPDLVEIAIGLDPLVGDWQTDRDGDGWSDFDEWLREDYLDVSGSPLDTDGDGWSDFDESIRGTDFSTENQSLQTVSADHPAPELGTVEYERVLQLFRDVPAATRLYEVEYRIPDSVAVINANSIWQSYSSYVPGGKTIFSSDDLLATGEIAWATVPSADSFERISVQQLKTLKLENRIDGLRLPAGESQVLDVLGIEYKILENAEFSEPSERRTWHSMKWLAAKQDASPLTFEPAVDAVPWETAEDWKVQFIDYLGRYLVQATPVSAEYPVQTIDQKSTTDVTIMLALLSEEFELAGEIDSREIDLPKFNQADAMTARVVENLQQALGLRNEGRTLDSVITDLELLFQNDVEYPDLRSAFESRLNEFPFGTDYLRNLSDLVESDVLLDKNQNRRLKYLSRFALFEKGVKQLSLNDDLREEDLDIDTDGLDNETEILSTVYAEATLPWESDTDNDFVMDNNDPCPLDSYNACADIQPTLNVNSSFTVTRNEQGGYVVVTVQISQIYNQDISVDYTLEDDTAIMGEDFVGMSGTLMIPAGELTASIIINIPPINVENPDESFNLVLGNNQNVSLGQFSYPISIVTDVGNPDTTPDVFSFTDQTDVALSVVITSNSIMVAGINTAAAISITGGEYSIDGGTFTSTAGTVTNGQAVSVRQPSSASLSTTTDATLSIGGVSDTFSVTTVAIVDTTPDAFSFTDQTNVTLNTVITSNSITVAGIEAAAEISITGGEYSIDSGTFTSTAGTVTNGQTVSVRHTSSTLFDTLTSTLLSIGGVSETFNSTTGPIGTGFNQARGFNGTVRSISPANDGSDDVYMGGGFTTYNNTASNRVIRLNGDGTVDTGFALSSGFDSFVYSISSATDGSGDVYVGGFFTTYNGTASNHVIRLNGDGTVDAAFVVGSGFNNSNVFSISPAIDGSGDVYVGGAFSSYNGTASNRVIRLNSDGTVDAAFAVGSGFNTTVEIISPATDGSGDVYVGGRFTSYNGTTSNRVIRLNSDGTVDAGFVVGSGLNNIVNIISPATDGSGDVYVGGFFTNYNGTVSNRVIRLNSNGTVDAGFVVGSGFDNGVFSISPATDGSGDVYMGGSFTTYNSTDSNEVVRLNSDGTVDTAFVVGSGFDRGFNVATIFSIRPATDGSDDLYMGGLFTSYNGTGSNNVIRLNSDGTVDAESVVGSGFDNTVRSISPATDLSGDVYVVGSFFTYNGTASNRLIRLNSDGTVDASFVVAGSFNSTVLSISPTTDSSGDVYVGGNFNSYNGTNSGRLIRFNSNGTVDAAFNTGSGFTRGFFTNVSSVDSISPATDGSGDIYVGGLFDTYNGIANSRIIRLNNDGTIDTAFATGSGFNSTVFSISSATDSSGDVYVGGLFTSYNGIASNNMIRLNSDGTVDTAFDVGSGFNLVSSVVSPISISPATDSSGDVYVGGSFTSYNGTVSRRIIRLNSNGTVDTAFDVGSGFAGSNFDSDVLGISPATDGSGDVYVGGDFTSYNGTNSNRLIRLNSDGTVDTAFATGSGFNSGNSVDNIIPATDGSGDVYVGGSFSSYQTTTVGRIVRLNPDGSLN